MTGSHALCGLTATRQAQLLQNKEVSSVELVRAHLDRIGRLDPLVRAFTAVFAEEALADAALSDARRARGEARGALDGMPVSVKECYDLKGLATTLGLSNRLSHRAAADAALVTLVREAGGVILG